MKIRLIEGFYGLEEMGSDSDYYLAPVSFPMHETVLDHYSYDEKEVIITNEAELREWAEEAFVEYTIWNMDVPRAAIVEED